jgi:single-stranded DNA-binding protein
MAGIKVHFDGKIGKQPELQGEGDKAWVQVGVATERWVGEGKGDVRNYNGQDQTTAYKTTWVNVVAFGRQAQYVAERFSPGDTIVINDGEMEFTTYSKKDKQSGNVIDNAAVGFRCVARDISGPFRVVPKSENNGNSNGNGGNGNHQQAAAPAQQPAPRQTAAPRQAAAPRTQAAAPAARQTQQRQSAPAAVQPAQQALIDDDIPF